MAIFNNPKPVQYIIWLFVLAFLAGLIWHNSHAEVLDAPYVQMSGGTTVLRGVAPVLDLTFTEPATQLKHAYWSESMTIVGTSNYNGQAVNNNMILRGLFLDGFGRFDLGLGAAYVLNPLPYNAPSKVDFNLQMDYRANIYGFPLTFTYTHISNAGIDTPNLGRDIVLVGYRFH